MKTLKFRPHLVKKIFGGEKTVTWRLFDDKDLAVGDRLEFLNWETGEKFAEAEITRVQEKPLGWMEDADFDGHEKIASTEEMLANYRKYYGGRVTLDTSVKMIDFELKR